MSDHIVTIASFAWMPEAQMAKNFLETEGIPAFLAGEETASMFPIGLGHAGEVQLQVHEQNAARAVSLLAEVSAKASLDEDWEAQAERGLWTCSVCGMAVAIGEGVCPACGTADDRVTTDRRGTWPAPVREQEPDKVKKSDQVQASPPLLVRSAGEVNGEKEQPPARTGCAVLFFTLSLLAVWLMCR